MNNVNSWEYLINYKETLITRGNNYYDSNNVTENSLKVFIKDWEYVLEKITDYES